MLDVSLTYGEYSDDALAHAAAAVACVRSLDLSGNGLTPAQLTRIADDYIAHMPHLQSLDLKDNRAGPVAGAHVLDVLRRHCPALAYLDVNENGMHDEAMYALALLLRDGALQTLYVVTNHITPRGLPTLCDGVVASRTLRELSLAYNALGDAGARLIAQALAQHATLQVLDVSDNNITDDGAVALARYLVQSPHSHLVSLNCAVNRIGDAGFAALADALTHQCSPHLRALDLGCNRAVGDAGRAALVRAARRLRGVTSLDLTSCDLCDDDAHGLALALRDAASSLTWVAWYNNPRITAAAAHELTEATYHAVTADGDTPRRRLLAIMTAAAAAARAPAALRCALACAVVCVVGVVAAGRAFRGSLAR